MQVRSREAFIIIADVVSSRMLNHDKLTQSLQDLIASLEVDLDGAFLNTPKRSLGDEVQMSLRSLRCVFETILHIEEFAFRRSMQFRYAVVFDEITGEAHDDIRTLSGAGLIHARDTIEEIKHDEDYRSALVRRGHVWFELQSREASKTFEAIFLTLSTIRSGWKQKHAEIAYRMIQGEKDKTIAKAVGYTQSAIWKRRQKMQIDSYLALRAVLKTLSSRGTLEELNLEAGR